MSRAASSALDFTYSSRAMSFFTWASTFALFAGSSLKMR